MSKIEWNEKTFIKFSYLSDVRISKDGKQIAYVLTFFFSKPRPLGGVQCSKIWLLNRKAKNL